jgi:hypothetical protein
VRAAEEGREGYPERQAAGDKYEAGRREDEDKRRGGEKRKMCKMSNL